MPAGEQLVDGGLITLAALRLKVRAVRPAEPCRRRRAFVPVDAEPVEAVENRLQRLGDVALGVGVVDPQDELPAVLAGEQPVEQRRANAADVQITGRAGSEAGANTCGLRIVDCGLRNDESDSLS